jgi:hypothetical protein
MFLDLTCGQFQYIQHHVSSIQYRRGKNYGFANPKHEEIKIFMQRWGDYSPSDPGQGCPGRLKLIGML